MGNDGAEIGEFGIRPPARRAIGAYAPEGMGKAEKIVLGSVHRAWGIGQGAWRIGQSAWRIGYSQKA
jgi:hypothetical protein